MTPFHPMTANFVRLVFKKSAGCSQIILPIFQNMLFWGRKRRFRPFGINAAHFAESTDSAKPTALMPNDLKRSLQVQNGTLIRNGTREFFLVTRKGRFFALSKLENQTHKKRKRKNRKRKAEKKQWLHYNELVFILTILDSGFHNGRAWMIPTTKFITVKSHPRTTIIWYIITEHWVHRLLGCSIFELEQYIIM